MILQHVLSLVFDEPGTVNGKLPPGLACGQGRRRGRIRRSAGRIGTHRDREVRARGGSAREAIGDRDVVPEVDVRARSSDPETFERRPPRVFYIRFTAAQRQLLRQWVAEGAVFQSHWSLVPPQRVTPPKVARQDRVATPVDAFILRRLEAAGLTPNERADRAAGKPAGRARARRVVVGARRAADAARLRSSMHFSID